MVATNLSVTNFTNACLTNGTIYYFVVSATNAAGESPNTAFASAQPVSFMPPQISFVAGNGQLKFAWPQDHAGWRLQVQTNFANNGLNTNWFPLPGSTLTNQMTLSVNPSGGNVFFRLVYP